MIFVAWILGLVLTGLAALHAYWACGGSWATAGAVPQGADGRALFKPGVFACLVVALALLAFAYVCLAHVALVPPLFLAGRTKWILLLISALFALRGIGDFRFVGLFRRIHPTDFSRLDRILYTPLCLVLAGLLALLA